MALDYGRYKGLPVQSLISERLRSSYHVYSAGTNWLDLPFYCIYIWNVKSAIVHIKKSIAMKKVFTLLTCALLTAVVYAYDPNEKVLKSFNETFTSAEDVKWEEYPTYYSVSFVNAGIRSKVNYDLEGNMTGSIRYYAPQMLPLNIFNTLKKQNPKKNLFGVTEVTSGSDVTYYVKIEDDKNWITLKVDQAGNSEVFEKYKKG